MSALVDRWRSYDAWVERSSSVLETKSRTFSSLKVDKKDRKNDCQYASKITLKRFTNAPNAIHWSPKDIIFVWQKTIRKKTFSLKTYFWHYFWTKKWESLPRDCHNSGRKVRSLILLENSKKITFFAIFFTKKYDFLDDFGAFAKVANVFKIVTKSEFFRVFGPKSKKSKNENVSTVSYLLELVK